MKNGAPSERLANRWPQLSTRQHRERLVLPVTPAELPELVAHLNAAAAVFAGIVAELREGGLRLHYPFCPISGDRWLVPEVDVDAAAEVPSVSTIVFAAD